MTKVDELTMLDIRDPVGVEIETSEDGRRIWVNVDGICRLRITYGAGQVPSIDIGSNLTNDIIAAYELNEEL